MYVVKNVVTSDQPEADMKKTTPRDSVSSTLNIHDTRGSDMTFASKLSYRVKLLCESMRDPFSAWQLKQVCKTLSHCHLNLYPIEELLTETS